MAIDDQPYKPPEEGFYMTDWIGSHACEMIEQQSGAENPFFLYTAFTSPHWPLHAHPQDIEKYRGKYMVGWDELRRRRHERMSDMGIVQARWPLTPRDERAPAWETVEEKEARDLHMAVYAAQIDCMDQNIGRILDTLEKTGAADNTLILFLADNGGCAEEINRSAVPGTPPGPRESYLSYGLPWANASNTPFRLYKHWVHEGGIATPLIAHWPTGMGADLRGTMNDEPGHLIDLMATCVDVAEAEYPAELNGKPITPLEGRSLRPVLETGSRDPHEAIYWEHEGNRAIRQQQWKLVSRYNTGNEWELYDLDADRTEMYNLAERDPDRRNELAALWQAWGDRAGVQPWDVIRQQSG
jgi:arylsulfatase